MVEQGAMRMRLSDKLTRQGLRMTTNSRWGRQWLAAASEAKEDMHATIEISQDQPMVAQRREADAATDRAMNSVMVIDEQDEAVIKEGECKGVKREM